MRPRRPRAFIRVRGDMCYVAGDRQSPLGSRVTIFLRLRTPSRRLHLLALTPMPRDSRVLFVNTPK